MIFHRHQFLRYRDTNDAYGLRCAVCGKVHRTTWESLIGAKAYSVRASTGIERMRSEEVGARDVDVALRRIERAEMAERVRDRYRGKRGQ